MPTDLNQKTAMLFRVDATVQGPHGNTEVVATRAFTAKNLAQAEELADGWANEQATIEAIVNNEMISSTRMFRLARWSGVGPWPFDPADAG